MVPLPQQCNCRGTTLKQCAGVFWRKKLYGNKKEKLLNYNPEDLFKVSLEVHDVSPHASKIMHQMLQPGGYDISTSKRKCSGVILLSYFKLSPVKGKSPRMSNSGIFSTGNGPSAVEMDFVTFYFGFAMLM